MALNGRSRRHHHLVRFVCFAFAWMLANGIGRATAVQEGDDQPQAHSLERQESHEIRKFPLRLSGRVIGPENNAIVLGTVQVVAPKYLSGIKTHTDKDGNFELRLSLEQRELSEVLLQAENQERTLLSYDVPFLDHLVESTGESRFDIRLCESHEAVITVVDENQFAVAGARVFFLSGKSIVLGPILTAEDGNIHSTIHDTGEPWTVIAVKKEVGFSFSELIDVNQSKTESRVRIVLEKAQPLRVQLRSTDDSPVIGARVSLLRIDTGKGIFPSRFNKNFDVTTEETDDAGEAWLDAFPFGKVTVNCQHPKHESYTITLNHRQGPEFVHKVSLRETAINRCRVIDEWGKPVANTQIDIKMLALKIYQNRTPVRTDDKGMLEFSTIVGKPYMISVRKDGLGAAAITGFGVVTQAESELQELRLLPLRKIDGTVRRKGSGEPVPNRIVYLLQLGATMDEVRKMPGADAVAVWSRPALRYVSRTDEQGRFQFEIPDGEYNISLHPNENHSNRFRLPGAETIRIELTAEKDDGPE